MASIRTTTNFLLQRIAIPSFRNAVISVPKRISSVPSFLSSAFSGDWKIVISDGIRCFATHNGGSGKKTSTRLSQVQMFLLESENRSKSAADEPPRPKIRLEHVSVSLAAIEGRAGQNASKENPKVYMRFNVKNATWLDERFRHLLLGNNRFNKDGQIVISSTKTRNQQENIQACLSKLQAILDAVSYVPPPLSEEQKKIIVQLAAKSEQKRLQSKKVLSQKKQFRK